MPQRIVSGFEDGFIEIVEEQLERCLNDVRGLDEEIAEKEAVIETLRTERGDAAKRAQQLEELLRGVNIGSHSSAGKEANAGSSKPFADADAVVELIREQGQAMHYRDIHQTLVARGYEIGGEGKPDTLLSRFFNDPRLARVSRGVYDFAGRESSGAAEELGPRFAPARPTIFPQGPRFSIPPMPAKGLKSNMTLGQKAAEVLRQANEPLHYGEITRRIMKTGAWQPVTKTPDASVNSAMVIDIRDHGDSSVFIREGRGIYGLRAWTADAP